MSLCFYEQITPGLAQEKKERRLSVRPVCLTMSSLKTRLKQLSSATPQSVAVIHNSLENLWFVKFLLEEVAVAVQCSCVEGCSRCLKFRHGVAYLAQLKGCACDREVGASQYPLEECEPLLEGESTMRSEELAAWWEQERQQWETYDYDEQFKQATVKFSSKLKRAEFLTQWRMWFPKGGQRYTPNPMQKRVLQQFGKEAPRAFLFFWALGSGKTLAALWYCTLFRFQRVLIVCSKTMVAQWLETVRYANCCTPGSLVVILTYDKLEMLSEGLEEFPEFDVAIVDECHYYKNLNVAKSWSFAVLERHIPHVVLLSGTPLRHSVAELEMYARLFGVAGSSTLAWSERITGGPNLFAGRVSYYNAADQTAVDWFYPELQTHVVDCPLTAPHNLVYLCKSGSNHRLTVGTVLLPTWGRGDELSRNKLLNHCEDLVEGAYTPLSAKLRTLLVNVRQCSAPQVVFSMYKHFHPQLLTELTDFRVRVLTGNEPPATREAVRKEFLEGSVDVLLLCRVGSDGLDLYSAHTLHLLEPQHNDAETRQVVGRVLRGKVTPYDHGVDVYHYCSTLDPEVTVSDSELSAVRTFCGKYAEVEQAILAATNSEVLSAPALTDFLRIANVEEGGTVEQKRRNRNAEGAVELQRGLQYLAEADVLVKPENKRRLR